MAPSPPRVGIYPSLEELSLYDEATDLRPPTHAPRVTTSIGRRNSLFIDSSETTDSQVRCDQSPNEAQDLNSISQGEVLVHEFVNLNAVRDIKLKLMFFILSIKGQTHKNGCNNGNQGEHFEPIWEEFKGREEEICATLGSPENGEYVRHKGGKTYKMHTQPCRPSGCPCAALQIMLNCPTLKKDTYTNLDSPPLDPKNVSTKFMIEKGISEKECCVYDAFPRRVMTPSDSGGTAARDLWTEFKQSHLELIKAYRTMGGSVTLIMGDKAENAYLEALELRKVRITHEVEIGRSKVRIEQNQDNEIVGIVVKTCHPSYPLRGCPRHLRMRKAISFDNACNFAFALVGLNNSIQVSYLADRARDQLLRTPQQLQRVQQLPPTTPATPSPNIFSLGDPTTPDTAQTTPNQRRDRGLPEDPIVFPELPPVSEHPETKITLVQPNGERFEIQLVDGGSFEAHISQVTGVSNVDLKVFSKTGHTLSDRFTLLAKEFLSRFFFR